MRRRYPAPAVWPRPAVSCPGAAHFQFAASPSAPLPEYRACCGYGQSGRLCGAGASGLVVAAIDSGGFKRKDGHLNPTMSVHSQTFEAPNVKLGAYRLDHPDAKEIDTQAIFPDLFRRLRDHSHAERKRHVERSKENLLRYLSDERAGLDDKARRHVEGMLATLRDRYGYCEHCAQDAVMFLMRRRYVD